MYSSIVGLIDCSDSLRPSQQNNFGIVFDIVI